MTDRKTRTVLIVDGSRTMLYFYGILLKRLEYSVQTATSPEEALTIMEQTIPSLVLTAVSFPSMSGVDFIRAIKGKDRTKAIPIIVQTAEEDASIRSACLSAGCFAYLKKPVDAGTLYRTIQAAMEARPRGNIRINTRLMAVVGDLDRKDVKEPATYATEISERGAYVRTLAPHNKDTQVPLRLYVNDREIRVKAVVLYTHDLEPGAFREPGMGLKFIEIAEDDRDYLRGFINAQLVSDITIDN